jgi:hypothetical protein
MTYGEDSEVCAMPLVARAASLMKFFHTYMEAYKVTL